MKTVKATNYTESDVRTMGELYTGEDNIGEVREIAATLGKSQNSVRAKLSNLGIYVKAEAVATAKSTKVTKITKATQIANLADLSEVETVALANTTGAVLDKLLARLTQ